MTVPWNEVKASELWPGEVILHNNTVYRITHIEYDKNRMYIYTLNGFLPIALSTEEIVKRA